VSGFLKILIVFAVSSIKFFIAPPLSFSLGLNFLQTFLSTSSGGITGVIFFYFLSKWIIQLYAKYLIFYFGVIKAAFYKFLNVAIPASLPPRKFTRRNRFIIKIVRKYGLSGIVVLTPVILSIPIGTFLATRYYASNRYILIYLISSVLFWSLLMSSAISLF
jgi:hypothetical protein